MERSAATPGRGIGAFVGRVVLGIVTCGLLGLAAGMVSKLIWDPNCENDCDVLWIICTVIGLLAGLVAAEPAGLALGRCGRVRDDRCRALSRGCEDRRQLTGPSRPTTDRTNARTLTVDLSLDSRST